MSTNRHHPNNAENLIAAIDVGSNSVKLLVAAIEGDRLVSVEDRVLVSKLGEGLDATGQLKEQNIFITTDVILQYTMLCEMVGAKLVALVGTEAVRAASNADLFISNVKKAVGKEIRILSGDEEAKLGYQAAASLAKSQPALVLDIGGGSVEFITTIDSKIWSNSFPLGCRRLTERFKVKQPLDMSKRTDILQELLSVSENHIPNKFGDLVAIGGTASTIWSMLYPNQDFADLDNGVEIKLKDIEGWYNRFAGLSIEQLRTTPGLMPERAEVISAGVITLDCCMQILNRSSVIVTSRSLRHGMLVDYLNRNNTTQL